METLIPYSELIDGAMRAVVREVLRKAAKSGLPGDHHFYVTFRTDHPGVKISETLKARYAREMTIVLQHQFWDFRVDDDQFHVTLTFSGVPERLTIPFSALTAFADPAVKFGLQFNPTGEEGANAPLQYDDASAESGEMKAAMEGAAEIISLDAFRKK